MPQPVAARDSRQCHPSEKENQRSQQSYYCHPYQENLQHAVNKKKEAADHHAHEDEQAEKCQRCHQCEEEAKNWQLDQDDQDEDLDVENEFSDEGDTMVQTTITSLLSEVTFSKVHLT